MLKTKPGLRCRLAATACTVMLVTAMVTSMAEARTDESLKDALNCPDSLNLDMRPDPGHDPERVREIAPSAGAKSSAELFNHARFAGLAYDLYADFVAGKDPHATFKSPDLKLVAMIYGDPGLDNAPRPKSKDTKTLYGFVADEIATGKRYFVFRGTQEAVEWARNAQMGQRPFPAGTPRFRATAHVHAGFYKIFESLTLETRPGASSLETSLPGLIAGKDVIFVGHSLGSALATFGGVEATRRSPERASHIRIVTVASPRVGDAGFAEMARTVGRIDRVCNMVDMVTAVPPSTPTLTYVHVGTVFRVSAFDWPALNNNLEKAGDQIGCWHSDQSYDVMLNPDYVPVKNAKCYLPKN